ncbi:hypothetical protein K4F52_005652 [Lecanicillium sp. MT-2017a]|nr:hypothetical protein K4F52_005652 [Lecanicillium sp. MT-2017a]
MSRPAIQAITRSARVDVNRSRSSFAKTLNQSKITVTAEALYDQGVLTTEQYNSLQSTEWDIDEGDGLRAWLNGDTIISTPTSQEGGRTQRYLKPDPYRPQGIFVELPAADIASKPSRSIEHQLSTVKDLYVIQPRRRHDIYLLMCHQLAKKYASQAAGQFLKYNECCNSLTYQKRIRDAALIKMEGVQVLACTVTGLSKYRTLIKELQPEVMLIDEASEAFESTIAVAALLPSLQQVSLVGDHQQLTPSPATELMKQQPYSLDVSLFERLVGYLDYKILLCQRRMVPNIRDIISEYYPDVHDHLSVSKRGEAVPGARNLWWFDHQWPETLTPKKSFCNFTEASMAVRLANHFIQAGVLAERITILTVYSGQVDAINKVIHSEDHGQARQVAVRTVDGFQGCENNLIILSLVRSHRPGFVADIHRATVALSRARDAMFVFGRVATLVQRNETGRSTWAGVLDRFKRQSAVGTRLSTTAEWADVLEQIKQTPEAIKEAQPSVEGRVPAAENQTSSTQSLDHAGEGEKLSAIELILSKFDSEYIMKTGYAACVLEPKLALLVLAPVATESGVYKGQGEFLIDMGAD